MDSDDALLVIVEMVGRMGTIGIVPNILQCSVRTLCLQIHGVLLTLIIRMLSVPVTWLHRTKNSILPAIYHG